MSAWITVITVVKDDDAGFERTLNSLLRQDLSGVDYLVVDSSSNSDGISALLRNVTELNHRYEWHDPRGIYSAMNAGIRAARGEYSYFLNAGDCLTHDALKMIHDVVSRDNPVWVVGEVRFVDQHGESVEPTPLDYQRERRTRFSRGRFPPHQGTFVRTEVLNEIGGFNLKYRISADYEMALRLSTLADPALCRNVVAEFTLGGVSSSEWRETLREFHQARVTVLQPRGLAALGERANTGIQFMKSWLARSLRRTW